MRLSPTAVVLFLALAAAGCGDAPMGPPAPEGEWLRGNLHLHSSHSTDAADNPVDVVIARAEALGMDYFVFTDHDNHVQGSRHDEPHLRGLPLSAQRPAGRCSGRWSQNEAGPLVHSGPLPHARRVRRSRCRGSCAFMAFS